LEEIGLGKLGMNHDEMYDLTMRSFVNKLKGFNDHQQLKTRTSWEQTRIIMHSVLKPYMNKNVSLKEVLPFEWDSDVKTAKPVSKKHIQSVIDRYENHKKNK